MKAASNLIFIGILAVVVVGFAIASGNINAILPGFGTDLGYMFEYQLDELNPDFISNSEATCEEAGGSWISMPSRFGCFHMPAGTFDTSDCNNIGYMVISSICESVKATVVCDDTDVGCTY